MRKLIIKYFYLSYFFEMFGGTVQLPRVLVWSFLTFSLGAVGSVNYNNFLVFIPFIIIQLIIIIYFKIKPVNFEDWKLMDNDQKYLSFLKLPQFSQSKPTEGIIEDFKDLVEPIFKMDYKNYNPYFSAYGSMILLYISMALLGVIYYYSY